MELAESSKRLDKNISKFIVTLHKMLKVTPQNLLYRMRDSLISSGGIKRVTPSLYLMKNILLKKSSRDSLATVTSRVSSVR
jgi:hypothetical protein